MESRGEDAPESPQRRYALNAKRSRERGHVIVNTDQGGDNQGPANPTLNTVCEIAALRKTGTRDTQAEAEKPA